MKVLWLGHISLKQDKNGKFFYPGGNWVSSLKELLINDKNIDLSIAFYGDENLTFEDEYGTKFTQLKSGKKNKLSNYIYNWQHKIESREDTLKLLRLIEDYQPDVIHIFGTENNFSRVLKYTNIPSIIHLQGLIIPYINAWNFPGLSKIKVLKNMNIILFFKGVGFFHEYFRFKKMADREAEYFNICTNFMGRTHWDRAITKLYAPKSNYFHCDEVIRESFYNSKWCLKKQEKFIISSTINPNIYKGLDLILKTANLLKEHSNFPFEWNVYGIKENNEYVKIVQDILKSKFKNNNVKLKGVVLENDLLNALLNSSLFVHSSYIDNSPNSVCEAQLIGLPVISTNVGGVSTLINNNIDGFLVPPNEPHVLASKIIDLYNNPDELKLISEKGLITAQKRHDKKKIKENLISIYQVIQNN